MFPKEFAIHYIGKLSTTGEDSEPCIRLDSTDTERRAVLTVFEPSEEFVQDLVVDSGEVVSWYCEEFRTPASRSIPHHELMDIAHRLLQLPAGARLEFSDYVVIAEEPAFWVRWHHFEGDRQVMGDHIDLVLNGDTGRPFAYERRWNSQR